MFTVTKFNVDSDVFNSFKYVKEDVKWLYVGERGGHTGVAKVA